MIIVLWLITVSWDVGIEKFSHAENFTNRHNRMCNPAFPRMFHNKATQGVYFNIARMPPRGRTVCENILHHRTLESSNPPFVQHAERGGLWGSRLDFVMRAVLGIDMTRFGIKREIQFGLSQTMSLQCGPLMR